MSLDEVLSFDMDHMVVGDIDILTPDERELVMVKWQGKDLPLPSLCAHQLFEKWASKHPDKTAVINATTEESITYGDLNVKANQLAWRLKVMLEFTY